MASLASKIGKDGESGWEVVEMREEKMCRGGPPP
jgi:hypothetical protein